MLEETRSLLFLPVSTFLLVSQGAVISPFFPPPITHLPLSRIHLPESEGGTKSKASEQVSPLRCVTRTGTSGKSANGVGVGTEKGKHTERRSRTLMSREVGH